MFKGTRKTKILSIGLLVALAAIAIIGFILKYSYDFQPWDYLVHRDSYVTFSIDPYNTCTYNNAGELESTTAVGTLRFETKHVLKTDEQKFVKDEQEDQVCFSKE
jgi:hypothetical protein